MVLELAHRKTNLKLLLSIFFASLLASCGKTDAVESGLVAEDVVWLSDQAFGCESKYRFVEAVDHLNRSEVSAAAAIYGQAPNCFDGGAFDPALKWTIRQIRQGMIEIAPTSSNDYQKIPAIYRDGRKGNVTFWTLTHFAKKTSNESLSNTIKKTTLQIASYDPSDKSKLDIVRAQLQKSGLNPVTTMAEETKRVRLRVGPFTERDQMEQAVQKIKELGLNATAVPE